MTMEAQVHYCALWKSADFEAYTVMQVVPSGCLSLSIRPNTTQPLQRFATLAQMLLCSQVVTEKANCILWLYLLNYSSQCIILLVQKKHLYQKKKKRQKQQQQKAMASAKSEWKSYHKVSQGQLSLMLPKVGIFKMLFNVHFFHFIDYSWVKNN